MKTLTGFAKQLVEERRGKGWFEIKDIMASYCKYRGLQGIIERTENMTIDEGIARVKHNDVIRIFSSSMSVKFKKMCDAGFLIRKIKPNHKKKYLYKVA